MTLSRRDFIVRTAVAGAAAPLAGCALVTGRSSDLPHRVLGRTGQAVPIVGLGCAYAEADAPHSVTAAAVEAALEGGIRYFDTSPVYTDSEAMLGPVLRPVRDEVLIATKLDSIAAGEAEAELAMSLKRLQTDYVDLLLQHGVGCQVQPAHVPTILGENGSLAFMRRAKERGLCRFIGMSIHAPHGPALTLLEAFDGWDVVMPWINAVSRHTVKAETEILPIARARGIGVVGMKVFGGRPGPLAADYEGALSYTLSVPGVACAVVGVKSVDEVRQAVEAARYYRPLDEAAMEEAIRRGGEIDASGSRAVRLVQRHMAWDEGSRRAREAGSPSTDAEFRVDAASTRTVRG